MCCRCTANAGLPYRLIPVSAVGSHMAGPTWQVPQAPGSLVGVHVLKPLLLCGHATRTCNTDRIIDDCEWVTGLMASAVSRVPCGTCTAGLSALCTYFTEHTSWDASQTHSRGRVHGVAHRHTMMCQQSPNIVCQVKQHRGMLPGWPVPTCEVCDASCNEDGA